MSYFTCKILSASRVKTIFNELEYAEWQDGVKTYDSVRGDLHKVKKNLECEIDPSIVHYVLDSHENFLKYTYAFMSSDPIVSRTPKGGYYKPHFDEPKCGHFSTTIFLSNPDDYDGGELVLLVDGEEKSFKLKPGESITYETGTPHRVNEVTRGDRYAVVFWTTSVITDIEDLRAWRYYDMMSEKYMHDRDHDDLISFNNSLYTHFRNKCNKIFRKYINVTP
jgi:PKHD-type hydroxylase